MRRRGFAPRSGRRAGGKASCPRAAAEHTEAVRLVGHYQGSAGAPCLIASHWSEPLRLAYLTGFYRGRADRRRRSALNASQSALEPDREAR